MSDTKLTKEQIRVVLDANPGRLKHTDECRQSPGNVKGSGGHQPSVTRGADGKPKVDLGGYRCVCDWMERVQALHDKGTFLQASEEAMRAFMSKGDSSYQTTGAWCAGRDAWKAGVDWVLKRIVEGVTDGRQVPGPAKPRYSGWDPGDPRADCGSCNHERSGCQYHDSDEWLSENCGMCGQPKDAECVRCEK